MRGQGQRESLHAPAAQTPSPSLLLVRCQIVSHGATTSLLGCKNQDPNTANMKGVKNILPILHNVGQSACILQEGKAGA